MKITVLGTAAATSVPLPFCRCEVCEKARQNGGKDCRKRSSIVINEDLLIDLGPDTASASFLYGMDLSRIQYLLQTHSHADHFDAGIFVTRHKDYATVAPTHLDILCSRGTFDDMNEQVKRQEPAYDLYSAQSRADMAFDYTPIRKNEILSFGDYTVHALDSRHDARVEAMNYIVSYQGNHILYAVDLLRFDEEAWEILRKYRFSLVFMDQTYGKGFNAGGHTDAGMVAEYVDRMRKEAIIDAETLVLATHISHEGNNVHAVMEEEAQKNGYHIAWDGMEISI